MSQADTDARRACVKLRPFACRSKSVMWSEISNIGDAALTLPVALTCAVWLALSNWRLALRWVAPLALGMSVVGAT